MTPATSRRGTRPSASRPDAIATGSAGLDEEELCRLGGESLIAGGTLPYG